MGLDLIFKVAGVGILVGVLHTILKQSGKEDYGFIMTIAGTAIVFILVIQKMSSLINQVKSVFGLW